MRVEIWSDVVCPWCYVGKRRFESALAGFPHRDEVEVVWRSFELEPQSPPEREGDPIDHLAAKYGLSRAEADVMVDRVTAAGEGEGLHLNLQKIRRGCTFDAHRLLHLAGTFGPDVQARLKERFMHGYFVDSEAIGRAETVARLAEEAGLPADEVAGVLGSDRFAAEVRADEAAAAQLGCRGVPFFVADRAYGVAGAQSPEVLTSFLEQAWAAANAS